MTGRDFILKARQKGVSSYVEADQFIDCLRKATNAVIISHEKEATKRLLSKVKYFINNLEIRPAIKYETRQDIFFEKTNSNFYIGTVGQKTVGRGDTIHRAHFSEAAYFEDAKRIVAGVSEAVPLGGRISIESTANGRGNWFYDEWQKIKEGWSIYKGHFFPWFVDDEYRLEDLDIEVLSIPAGIKARIIDPNLDDEEKEISKRYRLSIEQIRWRRYKKWDLGDYFFQEYPENDIDCFLQSGRPVFRIVNMDERPDLQKDRQYLGGLDGAEGIEGGDNHCFAVIDLNLKPAKVVYEITSNEPIEIFDEKVKKIVENYKIKFGIETHGIGVAHCQKFEQWGIPFEEWETNSATRPMMIVELEEAYRKDELRETYLEAKNELLDMFYDDKNRPSHHEGRHDDRVIARAIAWQMRKVVPPGFEWI